jgi:uncharacterized lipoprotein NlpE involved in copper resistance
MKKINVIFLAVAVVVSFLLLVGCGNNSEKTEFVMLGYEYLYSDKLSDGTDFADGFCFANDGLYYIMYEDGEVVLMEKWGNWDRSGDIITLNYNDGSSDTAEIVSKREISDGIMEADEIAIGDKTYTLES